ncbi:MULTISPECIES: catecholate siderophore receptor Fiu [Acinetobacter]|uniref:catecholate siderophore receptor Fiu n=1 Tax=Acinetobacter TaxID=469 RepID=UPI001436BE1A|nr:MULTISPECIES: catecholate siderophore receptor Fiu [Acinetobacter]MCA4814096.1 catecholate siderophore receptor Fiu [Acinetobacter towneri]QIV93225.1 catecholate siderophore receptor Fiu [Acinetobacter towneri]UNT64171.1 catecholate siderophore receptor Fiu [Acinetobacter towneri]
MAQIKSRKHNRSAQLMALAASLPLLAHAASPEDDVTHLPTITVKSEAESKYKADSLSSAKYTQPLLDTPQTISVIKKEILQEQGAISLVEALRNTPGITLQLGENGNTSAGDAFQMRGFSTQTSTYVDGIRDLGAISRDVFNLDQIEVVKGPSGSEAGRGAASGYINLVSKLPQSENSQEISASYNTAKHARLSADINQVINPNTAFRLNMMGQEGGVEGRDYIENNSYAIAPSLAFGLNTATRLYLYSQHIRQRNIPDGGIPTIGMQGFYNSDSLLATAPKVNRENFYGHVNDYEDVDADMFTAKIESDLTDRLKLTNITRVGKTQMNRVLTGINTGANGLRTNGSSNPAEWEVNRSRQGVDQENKILANQSTLNWSVKTGAVQHDVVAGMEFLKEQQSSKLMATQMPGEATADTPWANLYHPDRNQAMPALIYNGGYTDGETQTAAAYLFDTLKFGERFQLNGGVRVDYYETDYQGLTLPRGGNALVATDLSTHDTLFSWKLGAVYKPTLNSSIYAAYAKSLTPPGSTNFTLSESGNDAINAQPQETHHYELGSKWELLQGKLAVAAAAYRTENENQSTIDPISQLAVQEGKKRVDGVELSAVGQITDAWNVSAGVAHMKVKQLNQRSSSSTTLSERWSPEWTASLWSTYDWAGFKFGLGARYVDEQKRVVTDSNAPANMPNIPGYVVFDALAGYNFNKHASLNLNLYNLADKEYISTLNNGGGRVVLGQPRSAALSLNYKF